MKRSLKIGWYGSLLGAGLFFLAGAVRGEVPAKVDYSGSLRTTYDYRGLGGSSDQDAYAYWFLNCRNLKDQHVDIYVSGWNHADLDGYSSYTAQDPFAGITDASQQDNLRLLQFYVDIHNKNKDVALRYGRQYVDIADYLQMDGMQAMLFENRRIGGRVFFGQPVSYYESISGDLFGGMSLVGMPWKGNRSRVTYARYYDDSRKAADDHFFFDVRQQMTEELRARTYLSVMNRDLRMGGGDIFYSSLSDKAFDAMLGVRRWGNFKADTRAYSPLVEMLGDQEPYTMAYGRCTAQVLDWFYLSPGIMLRHPDNANFTNRNFDRYDMSFIFEPSDALSASVAVEYWNLDYNDSFFGLSGDVRYRYKKLWELSAGTAYLDYAYSQLTDYSVITDDTGLTPVITPIDGSRVEVSPTAYTYYLRGKWNIRKNLALRVSGEIEDDSTQKDLGYRVRTTLEVRL